MKNAIVSKGPKVTIQDIPIPEPEPKQVIIKVVVSGSNPKDWKIPDFVPDYNANPGDDIAGIVHSVGSDVWEFKPGDRVASFHEIFAPGGSFAEYAIGWDWTTFHIPKNVSFEEAAAIPLAAMTAAVGLHLRLGLPEPWKPVKEPTPLVVYGGAAAVGAYVIKEARLANIHPIIAVTGRGQEFVEDIIDRSKGDTIVDYRKGDEAVVKGIRDALKGAKLNYAYDAISDYGSHLNIVKVLEPNGHITLVAPGKTFEGIPETVQQTITSVNDAHNGEKDFAYTYFRYLARALAEGGFKGHPHEVIAGGLDGVEEGLRNLKEGKHSGLKYVFRIGETSGVKESL